MAPVDRFEGSGGRGFDPSGGLPDAAAWQERLREMAARLAEALKKQQADAAVEAARVLHEAGRLSEKARQGVLSAVVGEAVRDPASALRERVDAAFPEGSETRQSLGETLARLGGEDPRGWSRTALEAKVASALSSLGARVTNAPAVGDRIERARGFGPFGSGPGAVATPAAPIVPAAHPLEPAPMASAAHASSVASSSHPLPSAPATASPAAADSDVEARAHVRPEVVADPARRGEVVAGPGAGAATGAKVRSPFRARAETRPSRFDSDRAALEAALGGGAPAERATAEIRQAAVAPPASPSTPLAPSVSPLSPPPPGAVPAASRTTEAPFARSLTEGLSQAAPAFISQTTGEMKGAFSTLAQKALSAREALWTHGERDAVVRYGADLADEHVGGLFGSLGEAQQTLGLPTPSVSALRSALVALRESAASARGDASAAALELQQVVARASGGGVRTALTDLRDIGRVARRWDGELRMTDGKAALLAGLEARGGASSAVMTLAGARTAPPARAGSPTAPTALQGPASAPTPGTGSPPAPSVVPAPPAPPGFAEPPAESASGPGAAEAPTEFSLTEDDLARLGTGLDPGKPPPQTLWNEELVNTVCDLGRQRGGVTDAEGHEHLLLAGRLLEGAGAGAVPLGAAEIAAALKAAGVALEKVDPGQLEAASRYVSAATRGAEQQERLRKTLDNFTVLSRTGFPPLPRQQMVEQLWAIAKVPGHALEKLSDTELQAKFQEVLAAVNSGPGQAQIKVGDHNLKFTVGANGTVSGSETKKPGFFSKIGGFIKKVTPIALTVLSFIPVTAPFARIAQGAISLVRAIKSKSLLGAATAVAGMVAGGATAVMERATGAAKAAALRVADLANAAARGLQGYSAVRQGSALAGLANIGGAIASGVGAFAGRLGTGLSRFQSQLAQTSDRLLKGATGLGAVQSYQRARGAVGDAQQALRAAEASGDPRLIAEARSRLEAAERESKAALLGGLGTAGLLAAEVTGQRRTPGSGEPIDRGPASSFLEAGLRVAGRGLSGASDAVRHDWESFGANALGAAAAVQSGVQSRGPAPEDPVRRRVDALIGLGPRVSTLNDASNLADALVSQRQSDRGEADAARAVEDAETALRVAMASGDPEAVAAARANLDAVRRGREGALMGAIGAGDSLLRTAEGIGENRRQAGSFEVAREGAVRALAAADTMAEQAAAVGGGLPGDLRAEAGELSVRLEDARLGYEQRLRLANGDPNAIEAATWGFIKDQMGVWAGLSLVERLAADRLAPRLVPASATSSEPIDPRLGARSQLDTGRAAVAAALEEDRAARAMLAAGGLGAAGGLAVPPESPIEEAGRAFTAALDNLKAVLDTPGSGFADLHQAQMQALLAQHAFNAARNPNRTASDPPPWVVGVGTFTEEFGKGALAVVSLGGTAGIERAYREGRLDGRSGPVDVLQAYLEGIFNGITFGAADGYVDARAGEGRGVLSSMAAGAMDSLRGVSGYDDLMIIFADPKATSWDRAQAVAMLTAKWAGAAALGLSGRAAYRNWAGERAALAEGTSVAGVGETIPPKSSVWSEQPLKRGQLAEEQLAKTEYKDWYHVGAERGGTFELVDFQKGKDLVSLKTVDTAGKGWMRDMHNHIRDLGSRGATVGGRPASMILDLRVPPGGLDAAAALAAYGKRYGVTVVITEFP